MATECAPEPMDIGDNIKGLEAIMNNIDAEHIYKSCKEVLDKIPTEGLMRRGDFSKESILEEAVKVGRTEWVDIVLDNPKHNIKNDIFHVLWRAVEYNRIGLVKRILADERFKDVIKIQYETDVAATKGHEEILKMLFRDPRVNVGFFTIYSLPYVVKFNEIELMDKFLKECQDELYNIYDLIKLSHSLGHKTMTLILLNDRRCHWDNETKNKYLPQGTTITPGWIKFEKVNNTVEITEI